MKIIYMGTPQFAVQPLLALAGAGHEILGVVTRIDKPAGRGRVLVAPPVKLTAREKGFTVFQPRRVREPEFLEVLRTIAPDVIVVAAYGQILPREMLVLPKYGCLNIHASLLPLYRGAAPINWAIVRGETHSGITIMQMDEGMDTGGILLQEGISIEPQDTAGTLTEKLSLLGAKLIITALQGVGSGTLMPVPQDGSRATLAPLLKKGDGLIDWKLPASEIHRRIRGLSPWPGAYSYLDGKMVKIIVSEVVAGSGEPGSLYEQDKKTLDAGTGSGMLRIRVIQLEGKKPMTAEEFLRGQRGIAGKKFEERSTKSQAPNIK
jgi:methionyl-tRNA formyltransferase